jgi:biopolymer transport protein ExbD
MAMQRRLIPEPPRKTRPDVSLAIVNIVLLLILFFLATGTLMNASSVDGVELSQTRDLPLDQLPSPILVVEPTGTLLLDGEPVSPELLAASLTEAQVLHVLIDRTAPAQDLLELLARPGLDRLDIKLVTVRTRGAS